MERLGTAEKEKKLCTGSGEKEQGKIANGERIEESKLKLTPSKDDRARFISFCRSQGTIMNANTPASQQQETPEFLKSYCNPDIFD